MVIVYSSFASSGNQPQPASAQAQRYQDHEYQEQGKPLEHDVILFSVLLFRRHLAVEGVLLLVGRFTDHLIIPLITFNTRLPTKQTNSQKPPMKQNNTAQPSNDGGLVSIGWLLIFTTPSQNRLVFVAFSMAAIKSSATTTTLPFSYVI